VCRRISGVYDSDSDAGLWASPSESGVAVLLVGNPVGLSGCRSDPAVCKCLGGTSVVAAAFSTALRMLGSSQLAAAAMPVASATSCSAAAAALLEEFLPVALAPLRRGLVPVGLTAGGTGPVLPKWLPRWADTCRGLWPPRRQSRLRERQCVTARHRLSVVSVVALGNVCSWL
jgi:hypothetical protein